MPIILRIDVDKPYGNNTLFRKVISKVREDYCFPAITTLGFLDQVASFARLLYEHGIPGIFYFRNCTTPKPELMKVLQEYNHAIGFHAENTRSFETFTYELTEFANNLGFSKTQIHSFSKHGSGYYKLGKNHYAPYEEDKYLEYAAKASVPFYFGNGMLEDFAELPEKPEFFPKVFWIENEYRLDPKMTIEALIEQASNSLVPVLIHPENYYNRPQTKADFDKLLQIAYDHRIAWKIDIQLNNKNN